MEGLELLPERHHLFAERRAVLGTPPVEQPHLFQGPSPLRSP
jgi:hypothetical protein